MIWRDMLATAITLSLTIAWASIYALPFAWPLMVIAGALGFYASYGLFWFVLVLALIAGRR